MQTLKLRLLPLILISSLAMPVWAAKLVDFDHVSPPKASSPTTAAPASAVLTSKSEPVPCETILGNKPESESAHWRNELQEAALRNSEGGMVYALARLVFIETKLSRDDRADLKDLIRVIELRATRDQIEQKYSKLAARALTFAGLIQATSKDVYGVKPYHKLDYKKRILKPLAQDFVVTFGITGYVVIHALMNVVDGIPYRRLTETLTAEAKKLGTTVELAKIKSTSELEAQSPLNLSIRQFLAQTREKKVSIAQTLGRVLIPLAIVSGSVAATGQTPYQHVREPYVEEPTYQYRDYQTREYLNDIHREIPGVLKGKVLVAYSDSLFPFVDNLPVAPLYFKDFRELKNSAQQVDFQKMSSLDDLAGKDLSQYDDVILFFHGLATGIPGGLPEKQLPRMKNGANLIFYSCSLGKAGSFSGESNEDWIEVSKQMLNAGRSVVATQDLVIYGEGAEPSFARKAAYYASLIAGGQILQDAGSALPVEEWLGFEFAGKPKGLRIYDSKDGNMTYVPSVESTNSSN